MHVQIPEKSQHQTSNYGLKQRLLIGEQGLNEAENEQDADRQQQQSGEPDEGSDQSSKPKGNMRMWRGQFTGAALAADCCIPWIRVPVRTSFRS
jgi:hypothetical protein